MKLQRTKLGFTLIELMVVITIIGILATGAVSVYTSQIQKARDSNRITSLKALQGAFEQSYSDNSVYPDPAEAAATATDADCASANVPVKCLTHLGYMKALPVDEKSGQKGASDTALDFIYAAGDEGSVSLQVFEVSIGFEAKASVSGKAFDDGGADNARFEVGNGLNTVAADDLNTVINLPTSSDGITVGTCLGVDDTGAADTSSPTKIVIKG